MFWQQESQVRLTAQRILSDHLRQEDTGQSLAETAPSHLWHGIRLDLTGATLIDFNLAGCLIGNARFDAATFSGDARFDAATFSGDARFGVATFIGDASFDAATFGGDAGFGEATFGDAARFAETTFNGDARFAEATFSRTPRFDGATFNGSARFTKATFRRGPTALSFQSALVGSPGLAHAWPDGWRLDENAANGATVVPISSSTTPGPE